MIEIRKVQTINSRRIDRFIEGENQVIDGKDLLLLPALIDPHVHFRVPGTEHKETWETAAAAAIAGGVTTVFDMPNNSPSCITTERLAEKKRVIDGQLKRAKIPLRYGLYLGADQNHLEEMVRAKEQIVGLKIYMGSSTGDLLMDNPTALDKAFRIAGENDILVAVHAEDERMIESNKIKCKVALHLGAAHHSIVRNPEVAARAVRVAIDLAREYGTRLYIAHVSTREELVLIREAKNRGLPVYAEATPHHLFLTTQAYEKWGTRALLSSNHTRRSSDSCKQLVGRIAKRL